MIMNELFNEFHEGIVEIQKSVDELIQHLKGHKIPKSLRDGLTSFNEKIDIYNSIDDYSDEELVAKKAQAVTVYGMVIGQAIPNFPEADEKTKSLGDRILGVATNLRNRIETTPLNYQEFENGTSLITQKTNKLDSATTKNELKKIIEQLNTHEDKIKKAFNEFEVRLQMFGSNTNDLESSVNQKLNSIEQLHNDTLEQLESKKQQIDEILGHVSGRAIAGDFEKSASSEKRMADWLRYESLGCMFLIVCVVSYSFYETTQENFSWDKSLFRIALAFFLSVPAAYLARESAKHREQEYTHLQTSLDLKAITPYISSLPEEEQHKLKISIANRLFAARDFSRFSSDSYPINTQDIIMEIIKKLELKNSAK